MEMVMDTVPKSGAIYRAWLADVTRLSKQTISDVVRDPQDEGGNEAELKERRR
jgi:hypothetical protein